MNKPNSSLEDIQEAWRSCVAKALQTSELDGRAFSNHAVEWGQVWNELSYQPNAYQRQMVDYQHEYHRGAGWVLLDASLTLHHDRKPIGVWLLTLGCYEGKTTLSSAGAALLPPLLLPDLANKTVKSIGTKALAFIQSICSTLQIPMPLMEWPVTPAAPNTGLSEWQQQLLRSGALPSIRYELYVDLQPEMAQIRNGFRKSYKPLISKGLELFSLEVLDKERINRALWSEFKNLHFEVAGRRTRVDSSWDRQYEMIPNGTAFLVTVRDRGTSRLVGAGFFQCTRDEGLYSVAAYDRNLFDKPIGHAVQQVAIERMKSLGLKWYRIGERRYTQQVPPPSAKEISIGEFKHGFASHEFVRFEYRWTPESNSLRSID